MTLDGVLTFEQIKTYPRTHRYLVFAETKPGSWFNVRRTNTRSSAVDTANFWDEKVNVEFIDAVEEAQQKVWAAEREVERVKSLPISEQLALSLQAQLVAIDKQAADAIASI